MKQNKIYSSFEEIDNDLRILKLTKEIESLELKNNISDLKEQFSVKNVLTNSLSALGVSLFDTGKKRWLGLALDYALYFLFKKKIQK